MRGPSRASGFLSVCRHRIRVSPMNGFGEGVCCFENGLVGENSLPVVASRRISDDAILLLLPRPPPTHGAIDSSLSVAWWWVRMSQMQEGEDGALAGEVRGWLPGVSLMGEGDGRRKGLGLF